MALRKAKIIYNFGLSECNRFNRGNVYDLLSWRELFVWTVIVPVDGFRFIAHYVRPVEGCGKDDFEVEIIRSLELQHYLA